MASNFKNCILIVVFNYASCLNNIDFLRSMYEKHFKKIVFYSDVADDNTTVENVNYVEIVRGYYTHRVFTHFYDIFKEEIKECDGIFYTMDDNILNTNLFHNMNVKSVITAWQHSVPLPTNDQKGWQWDNPVWGKAAIQKMESDPRYHSLFHGFYFRGRFSDYFFLPKSQFNDEFIEFLSLCSKYNVFLELAIPSAIDWACEGKVSYAKIQETVLWGKDREKINNKEFFYSSFTTSFIVHPVKFNANHCFKEWLSDIFRLKI